VYIEDYWTGAQKQSFVMLFQCATLPLWACPRPPPRSPSQKRLVTMVLFALDLSTGVAKKSVVLCTLVMRAFRPGAPEACGLCVKPKILGCDVEEPDR